MSDGGGRCWGAGMSYAPAGTGAATLSFAPALLGQALPPLRPVTDHVASWVLFSIVVLALQAALVRRARAKDGAFPL